MSEGNSCYVCLFVRVVGMRDKQTVLKEGGHTNIPCAIAVFGMVRLGIVSHKAHIHVCVFLWLGIVSHTACMHVCVFLWNVQAWDRFP